MTKFKIGDKVITKKFDGHVVWFNPEMAKYVGMEGTIGKVGDVSYNVHGWYWPEEALELAKEAQMNKMPELQTGNRITYRNGHTCVYIKDTGYFYNSEGYMRPQDSDDEEWKITFIHRGYKNGLMLDFNCLGDLLWEYKEPVVPTEADILREQIKELKGKLRELGEE